MGQRTRERERGREGGREKEREREGAREERERERRQKGRDRERWRICMHASVCSESHRERQKERHRDRKREKDKEQGRKRERERERRSKMSGWLSGGLPPGGFESYEKLREPKKTFTEASAATPQQSGTIPLGGGAWGPRPPIVYGAWETGLHMIPRSLVAPTRGVGGLITSLASLVSWTYYG